MIHEAKPSSTPVLDAAIPTFLSGRESRRPTRWKHAFRRAVVVMLGTALLACGGGTNESANPGASRSVLASGSGSNGSTGARRPIDDPIPGGIRNGAIQAKLQTIAEGDGLTAPNWGTFAPGQPQTLYVVDQDGPLWAVDVRTGAKAMCLNTRDLLVPLFPGDERGFLGAAFHPQFLANGLLYTSTSEPCPECNPLGQPNHRSVIREWQLGKVPTNLVRGPVSEDPSTAACAPVMKREVYTFRQPQFNHNGGAIFFGRRPDDSHLLYMTSGDGGCADDQDGQLGLIGEGPCIGHGASGNGQNPNTPLGKILRFDPARASSAFAPADVYALGFRNPFRASADRTDLGGDGGIWTGDVGQNHLEEVNGPVVQGGNYGWRIKEASFLFDPAGFELFGFASDGFPFLFSPGVPAGLIDPVAAYDHDEGVAVVGGFVYRGSAIPALRGRYVFGDYSHRPNSGNGLVTYLDMNFNPDPNDATPRVVNLVNGRINVFVHGFGEDAAGELYVLSSKTGVPFEETGLIMKIVPRCAAGADCRD
jgi:glucose/arabinose dehydrogenase